jgi:hypothetical protein
MRDVTDQPSQASRKELREFGLVTGAIAAVLFGLLLPWLFDHRFPLWPWIVAGVLWAWGLALPTSLRPVYRGWLAIGHVLGWLNTRIILAVMFYALFLPVGIVMRLLGKDPMARRFEQSKTTYRVTHAHPKDDHVERPY